MLNFSDLSSERCRGKQLGRKPVRLTRKLLALFLVGVALSAGAPAMADTNFLSWAATPTLGWNSWDFYGTSINEDRTKAQADYMETHLLPHGWDLITVDIQWYQPTASGFGYDGGAIYSLSMDVYGRLTPATNRFPSAVGGAGFKPLADYVHSKGLRFGIHIMRGIPKMAYALDTPISNSVYTARDVANTNLTCTWNPDMYGVDMSKPGAQDYYNSLFDLYASWGVDFIKVDDLSRPYHQDEIEAIRTAIDQCGRPIVFSTSPGETPLGAGENVMQNANQWRISDDFWDNWGALYAQFKRLHDWTPYRGPGHFPDADMLPMGKVQGGDPYATGRWTYFTADEQYTMMSLWSIARSPLIHGGDMTQMDAFTLSLMTNDEVIAVNQQSSHNRQLFNTGDKIAWVADADDGSSDKYLALFNAGGSTASVSVNLADLGYNGSCTIRDLWAQNNLGSFSSTFSPNIAGHGAKLYHLSGTVIPTPWLADVSVATNGISLTWEAIGTATSYKVKRASSEFGSYATIASGVTNTSFVDATAATGVGYYYKVSAMVGGTESPNSNVRHGVLPRTSGIISWNWNSWSDSPTGASPTAGVSPVSAPYWNDTWIDAGNSGTDMTYLRDNVGGESPVAIGWGTANTYSIYGGVHLGTDSDGTMNRELLNGYLNCGGSQGSSLLTLFHIPYAVYDIYIYFSSDTAGRQGLVSDGASTYYFNTLGSASVDGGNALLVQATNTTTAGYAEACDYARFSSLTGAFQTIYCNIPNWGGIASVQVVGRQMPVINSFAVTNGMATLDWDADTLGSYRVEGKSDLMDTNGWNVVTNGLSGGTNITTNIPATGNTAEFFRIFGE